MLKFNRYLLFIDIYYLLIIDSKPITWYFVLFTRTTNLADLVVTPYNIVGLFAYFMGIEHYNYNKLIFITINIIPWGTEEKLINCPKLCHRIYAPIQDISSNNIWIGRDLVKIKPKFSVFYGRDRPIMSRNIEVAYVRIP